MRATFGQFVQFAIIIICRKASKKQDFLLNRRYRTLAQPLMAALREKIDFAESCEELRDRSIQIQSAHEWVAYAAP